MFRDERLHAFCSSSIRTVDVGGWVLYLLGHFLGLGCLPCRLVCLLLKIGAELKKTATSPPPPKRHDSTTCHGVDILLTKRTPPHTHTYTLTRTPCLEQKEAERRKCAEQFIFWAQSTYIQEAR